MGLLQLGLKIFSFLPQRNTALCGPLRPVVVTDRSPHLPLYSLFTLVGSLQGQGLQEFVLSPPRSRRAVPLASLELHQELSGCYCASNSIMLILPSLQSSLPIFCLPGYNSCSFLWLTLPWAWTPILPSIPTSVNDSG